MSVKGSMHYRDTGVLDNTELGLRALLGWVNRTSEFRGPGQLGRKAVEVGFYASVVDIGHGLGLALCTDGVGTKVLVAQMLERYDTIGIDCVAMNVNDAICVGAEPMSFLDYIAIESATPAVLEAIGKGLYEGARQAGVNIVGGEISQMGAIIKGERPGQGIDLVGMCAGIVPLDRIIVGRGVKPGDAIVGFASSGIHSNGFTLARKALFEAGGLKADEPVAELGTTVGEELLKPTRIYVKPVMDLLRANVPVRALAHITSDGFLNLARIDAQVGFRVDRLPAAPAHLRADPALRRCRRGRDVPRLQHGHRLLRHRPRGRLGDRAGGGCGARPRLRRPGDRPGDRGPGQARVPAPARPGGRGRRVHHGLSASPRKVRAQGQERPSGSGSIPRLTASGCR